MGEDSPSAPSPYLLPGIAGPIVAAEGLGMTRCLTSRSVVMDNPTPEGELTMTNTQTRAAGNDVDVPSVSAERSHWTLVAVALATFMTYLDNNIVNVAMPVIERDLHLTTSGLEWVVSSYILVFASLLLAGGRLADVWGRKRLFVIGLSVFTVASLAAGMAGNVDVLVISRAMQGLGAAMVTPTTLAIISATFANPRQRAAAVGIWSGVGALALAVGPLLGGVLSQYLSWGWIFFVNVPVGLATLALGAAAIRESREGAGPRRLDLPGVITSAGALFALTFALIEGHDRGWTSTVILACFAVAGVLGVIFVRVELRVSQPMVTMSLFRAGVLRRPDRPDHVGIRAVRDLFLHLAVSARGAGLLADEGGRGLCTDGLVDGGRVGD